MSREVFDGYGNVIATWCERSNVREFIAEGDISPGDRVAVDCITHSNEGGTTVIVRRTTQNSEVYGYARNYARNGGPVDVVIASGSQEYPAQIPGVTTITAANTGPMVTPSGDWVIPVLEDIEHLPSMIPMSWGASTPKPKRRRKRKAKAKKVAPVPFVDPPGTRRFSF